LKKYIVLICTGLVVSGCVPVGFWVKEGVRLSDHQRTQTGCEVKAAQDVPTNTQVGWAPYVGVYSADQNANLRQRVIAQCMGDNGYQLVELPQCSGTLTSEVRSGKRPPKERMHVSPQSCWVSMPDGSFAMVTP